MPRPVKTYALIASLAASGMLAACGGGSGSSTQLAGTGSLQVAMTDAPACGFDAVNVTVNKVRVHQSADAQEGEAGWTDITLNPARKINLLDLTNGVLEDLGQTALPAGHYTQVRLVLDPNTGNGLANSVVLSGSTTEVSLSTPSAVQSGIKLVNEFDVTADQQTSLVLDFDACKSIVKKGNGKYALKPVIKIVPTTLNGIEGYVDKSLLGAHVAVSAQQNGAIIGGTVPDPDTGRFLLARLPVGDYDVVITADDHAAAVVSKVPVVDSTSTVPVSSSAAPIALPAAPGHTLSGTVTLNPAAADVVPYIAARQSFASGTAVTIKYRGADVADGSYSVEQLPSVAPMLGQYSATLPITFTAQTDATPGAAKYAVEYGAEGYQSQTATVDASTADTVNNVTLAK